MVLNVGIVRNISVSRRGSISWKIQWEIENFITCRLANCKTGDFLESPKFTIDSAASDISWCLRLYPMKQNIEVFHSEEDYFLFNERPDKSLWGFYLYADNKRKPASNFKILKNPYDEVTYGFGIRACRQMKYQKLIPGYYGKDPANGIVQGDKFTIVYKITDDQARNQEVVKRAVVSQILNEYEALLNNSKFSDVSLISSEGQAVKVHKCILAGRSSVFAAMFDADMREKQENIVNITDIKYDVLVEMVSFIYAGKMDNIDKFAYELAVAADKYALDELKNACEETMIRNLNLDSVIDYAILAEKLHMDNLKENAIEFLIENAKAIIVKPEFDLLSHDILRKIISCLAVNNG